MHRSYCARAIVALVACIAALAGCAYEQDSAALHADDVAGTTQHLWSLNSVTYWPDGVIPTCYKNGGGFGSSALKTKADAARAIAEAEFETIPNAAIDFTGWGVCPSPVPYGTLRFVLNRGGGGGNSSVGYDPEDAHTFAASEQDLGVPWDSYVLHELTHVLGFKHEFDRLDSPIHIDDKEVCQDGPKPDADPNQTQLTVYDPDSVASQTYCVRARTGHLSALDRLGMEIAYYDSDGTQSVGGRYGLYINGGVVIRAADAVVTDWGRRGAARGAFGDDPVWTGSAGGTYRGTDYPTSRLPQGVLVAMRAEFEDFRGRSHLASGSVKVDTGLHTALITVL